MAIAILAAALIVVCCTARGVISWRNYGDVEKEAGIWTTLALDATHGILYRPLISDLGYGGTRYAPLHFLIHAGLIKAGLAPVLGGFLLGIAATVLAMAGFFVLLRRLDLPVSFAIVAVSFFLAALCVRSGILCIKTDILAAGLNIWGLAAATFIPKQSRGAWLAILLAALCFALTATAKVTGIFGITASFLWLALGHHKKQAILLAITYAILVLLAVLAVQWASDGRAVAVFRACASAGGGIHRFLKAPAKFAIAVVRHDKAVGGFWILAILMLLATRKWIELPTILLIVTSLGTLAIFGTRATDINHLIDLDLASLLLLAVQLPAGRISRIAIPLATSAIVIHASVSCLQDAQRMRAEHRRQTMRETLRFVANAGTAGPILAENPILPILAGQRPYMLDAFMLSVLDVKHPWIGDKLRDDLAHQRFSAVVVTPELTHNTEPEPTDPWPGLLAKMKQQYELKIEIGRNFIYLPKGAVHGQQDE